MKTKWGACNIEQRRIWVNLELAKKSDRCLEYNVVHELMNKHLPSWRQLREELNRTPLAHEEWEY